MLKRLLATISVQLAANGSASTAEFYKPYPEPHGNFLYNLLFCDDIALFRNENATKGDAPWSTLMAEKLDVKALQALAVDEQQESRVRALAFNRLRKAGHAVTTKRLLGVIVEVSLEHGLDVLTAYADGRVRYLNYSGKIAMVEVGGAPEIEDLVRELITLPQPLLKQIGPWDEKRLPPPKVGNARMTFLVSDGLYFGEGPLSALQQDAMGGPILEKATHLLHAVVEIGAE